MRKIDNCPIFRDDISFNSLKEIISNNIIYLERIKDSELNFGPLVISADNYLQAMKKLAKTNDKREFIQLINNSFNCYEVFGKKRYSEILLTSYYVPMIRGKYKKSKKYSQPIYSLPTDLVELSFSRLKKNDIMKIDTTRNKISARVEKRSGYPSRIVPYYTREEIDKGLMLSKKNLELLWLDPIDAFFLQIQGSGTVKIGNKKIRVGYAGQNGWKYVSIGKYLYDIIPKEEMSLQRIEDYLRTLGRKKLYDFLMINPSYVFFKKLKGKAKTTAATEVVDGRTLAVDKYFFPLGGLAFLEFQKPIFLNADKRIPESLEEKSRFVVAHDTGGAIKSAGRADLFWGTGKFAKQIAGFIKHPANLFFLVPKK